MDQSPIQIVSSVIVINHSTHRFVILCMAFLLMWEHSSDTPLFAGGDGMANYNEKFIEAWKQTTNYQVWRGKEHTGIDDVHAG